MLARTLVARNALRPFRTQKVIQQSGRRWQGTVVQGLQESRVRAPLDTTQSVHIAEISAKLHAAIDADAEMAKTFKDNGEINFAAYDNLVAGLIPAMSKNERKSLFISMDTSNDGNVQISELFSDVSLAVLQNRMVHDEPMHPLLGSYYCLPSPPFKHDPLQVDIVKRLGVVFDAVIAAASQPLLEPKLTSAPDVQKKPRKAATGGSFSSIFGSLNKPKGQNSAKQRPKKQGIPVPQATTGAYLYGGCGCGKTVMLDLFFRTLPTSVPARRLHYHEFIRDALRMMQGHPPGSNVYDRMAESMASHFRILLIDELLVTHVSEALLIKNLFRHLWSRGVTIVVTSNYKHSELYAGGFNRESFEDFLPELEKQCVLYDMSGEVDYRRENAFATGGAFFHPIEGTSSEMETTFSKCVKGTVKDDVKLEIPKEKRSITVAKCGTDEQGAQVGWFSFEDLCGQSRGRSDYSTVSQNLNTVFLERVPKFSPGKGQEFQRFVSLIDMLYGKKVLLHLQSDVPVEELFADFLSDPEADLNEAWGYRRCTSMLTEMQSPKYRHMVWLMRNHLLKEQALGL